MNDFILKTTEKKTKGIDLVWFRTSLIIELIESYKERENYSQMV